MDVEIHWNRAFEVFDTLLESYRKNQYPYNKTVLPQRKENLPDDIEYGSRGHANYLFFSCNYMRGPIASEFALSQLRKVYWLDSSIFDPKQVSKDGLKTFIYRVYQTLISGRLHYNASDISKYWSFNAYKLQKFWQADTRNLFRDVRSYAQLQDRIADQEGKQSFDIDRGFKGFGQKMVSMLAYFYMEAGMVSEKRLPPPIDFHLLRVMTQCRLLTVDDPTADRFQGEYLAAARKLTQTYCEEKEESMIDLAEAMWLLSRESCSKYPGNRMHVAGKYEGRNTELERADVTWSKAQRKKYVQSCLHCRVQEKCELSVASAEYYKLGRLIARVRKEPSGDLVDDRNKKQCRQIELDFTKKP